MVLSSGARLAALYTTAFASAVVLLGATTIYSTRAALRSQFEDKVHREASALLGELLNEGEDELRRAVHGLDQTPGELEYGLRAPGGRPLAGRLAGVNAPLGWSTLKPRGLTKEDGVRIYTVALPGGDRLMLGDQVERAEVLDAVLLRHFGSAFLVVVMLGVLGGYGLTRTMRLRLADMNRAAEAIIDGDLAQRIPVRGAEDDLDQLGATLNRMLDRIAALMDSLRQVSDDVAHDLRTPLTRLRQRLEASLEATSQADRDEAVAAALTELDAILATFAALLRIAQIDSGGRRAGFRRTDLGALTREVAEAFAPSAEEAGQKLDVDVDSAAFTDGDAELITQLLVNLIENAMRHAGPSAHIRVRVAARPTGPELLVGDDGPGVPAAERVQLLDRFYRSEQSRSTPGSGLGLALVASIARLHDAVVVLGDAGPGLTVSVRFNPSPSP